MSTWFEGLVPPGYLTAVMVILGALLLLVLVLFLIRRFRGLASGTFVAGGRNRRARLAVMDAAAVDSRRRLVLVRRDDVEHLVLIGGPTDVVIEQGIRMAHPGRRHTDVQPGAPAAPAPVVPLTPDTQEPQRPRLVQPAAPRAPSAKPAEPVIPAAIRPGDRQPSPSVVSERTASVSPVPAVEPRTTPVPERLQQEPARQEPSFTRQEPSFARQEPRPAENVVTPMPLVRTSAPAVASEASGGESPQADSKATPATPERRDPGPRPVPDPGPEEISLEEEMSRLLGDLSGERR